VNQPGALLPAGRDTDTIVDAPVAWLIDDARTEAARLIAADSQCRNTVVILVVGGGEGTTVAGADPAARAATFLNISGRRVPIYVIAIAPPVASVAFAAGHRAQLGRRLLRDHEEHDRGRSARHAGARGDSRRQRRPSSTPSPRRPT